MLVAFLLLAAGFVAFTNGANANFKGVASLYGSGATSLRFALWWGTATTFAGSVAAIFLASGMLKAFSGKGLVPDALTTSPHFLLAVAIGGSLTSFVATRLSFPASTTHALLGALLGAGLASGDHTVHFGPLLTIFVQPLLISPLLAVAVGALIYLVLKFSRLLPSGRSRTLDLLHILSGGAASFARGLNDTPKMAALLSVVGIFDLRGACLFIGALIAIGGLVDAKNVAETLARKVTDMSPADGFCANLSTALLATTASYHSLPVSTTHVSVGSLCGIGLVTGQGKWKTVSQIVLSWLITVPCGAAIAALAMATLHMRNH